MNNQVPLETLVGRSIYSPPMKNFLLNELRYILPTYHLVAAPVQIMVYKNSTFNVPVQLVYYEGYPSRPPVAKVTPTPDMEIRANEFVREDGIVLSALIQRWTPQCNTKMLLDDLIAAFTYKMPVFAKATAQQPKVGASPAFSQSNYGQPQATFSQPQSNFSQPQGYQPQPAGYFPGSQQPSAQATAATFVTPLTEQYELKVSELISEVEMLEKDKAALQQSAQDIEETKRKYIEEQAQANTRLASIDQVKSELQQWVAANSGADVSKLPLETLLAVENRQSAALLEAMAKELAYEDAANAIVEAYGLKKCGTEDFLKTLKNLYRELFLELQVKERALKELQSAAR